VNATVFDNASVGLLIESDTTFRISVPSVESFQIAILINFLPTLVGDIFIASSGLVFEAVTCYLRR